MSERTQDQLQRDVEASREKLLNSISRVRGRLNASELTATLKQEAENAKDLILEKATATARSKVDEAVVAAKARVVANPAAALAIGAGIAWRLFQRPPVASVLIGVGLVSLLKTNPTAARGQFDFATAADRLGEQTGEFVKSVASDAGETLKSAGSKAAEWGKAAVDSAVIKAEELSSSDEINSDAVGKRSNELAPSIQPSAQDNLLLGIAGIAVAGAIGFASRRRPVAADEEA
jgi:hypothetical protein